MKLKQKRIISLFLAIMMLFSVLPAGTMTASAMEINTFNTKVTAFRNNRYANNSTYVNNAKYGGYQCFGFANEIATYIFGSFPTSSMAATSINSGWTRTYGGSAVDNLCVGDIVRYHYHSIFITGINGNTVTYCQANVPDGTNRVTYDNTITRSNLRSKVSDKLTSGGTDKTGWVAHFNNGVSQQSYISKPSAPKNVSAATTNGKLDIKWSSVSGATSYVVYVYSKSNCSEYAFKKETTACSISGIQLNPGRYWICVHAINSAGAGPGSNFVDYLTGPRNLKVTRVGTSIKLSWDSVPNANCYDVIITDPKGTQSWLHTDKAEKTISNCIPGSYKFEVQSLYRNNGSTTGQIVGAHSDVVSYYFGLNAPKNLKVNNNDGNMNISWDEVDGATCYDVIITTPNGKTDYWHSHSTNKTITGYEDGTYKIKVQGLYRENESKTGQIVSPHTDVIIYDYKKANQPAIHTHEWDLDYTIDENPTCTENGSKSIHCKTCDEVKNTKSIPAIGHKFSNWTVEKEATKESDGIESRKCQNCDYTETRNIDYIPVYDEDAPRISMANVDAKAGEEIEVRVKLENNPGITALRLVIDYDDTALEMTGFTFGDALASMNKGTSENYGNHYSFSMYSATADLNDCGTLAVIKFKVNENAEDGEYPIRITYDSDDIFNLNGESIHFDTGIGIVTVNSCLLGDINNDGKINMRDVVLLQQIVNGWNVTYNKDAADYNGDGKINMRDIVALQQYING